MKKTIQVIFRTDKEMVGYIKKRGKETGEGIGTYLRGLIRADKEKQEIDARLELDRDD